jgi:hypothetical protein
VRRDLLRVAGGAALVAVLLAALGVVAPVSTERLVDVFVLVAGGLLLLVLVRATGEAGGDAGSIYDRALRTTRPSAQRPLELESLERSVTLASMNAFDLHARICPVLREVAAHRLAASRGLRLESGSPEVRNALGPELWDLVRPDRVPPTDRFAPGLPPARLAAHVRALERL